MPSECASSIEARAAEGLASKNDDTVQASIDVEDFALLFDTLEGVEDEFQIMVEDHDFALAAATVVPAPSTRSHSLGAYEAGAQEVPAVKAASSLPPCPGIAAAPGVGVGVASFGGAPFLGVPKLRPPPSFQTVPVPPPGPVNWVAPANLPGFKLAPPNVNALPGFRPTSALSPPLPLIDHMTECERVARRTRSLERFRAKRKLRKFGKRNPNVQRQREASVRYRSNGQFSKRKDAIEWASVNDL